MLSILFILILAPLSSMCLNEFREIKGFIYNQCSLFILILAPLSRMSLNEFREMKGFFAITHLSFLS